MFRLSCPKAKGPPSRHNGQSGLDCQNLPWMNKESDHYLGMQYKLCARGEIGFFTNKQIISQLLEASESLNHGEKGKTDNAAWSMNMIRKKDMIPPQWANGKSR